MQNRENHHLQQENSEENPNKKENSIELHSPEIQELLGVPPRWIIRNGIAILLMVVLVLVSGSFIFRYPELVYGRITLLSENLPVQVAANSNGQIQALFAEENQQVQAGEIIGVIKSSVNFEDALRLMAKLDSFANYNDAHKAVTEIFSAENYSLEEYQSLSNKLKEWEHAFVLKAPVSGQIVFGEHRTVNQYVRSGDIVFTVVPDETGKISGRILAPAIGLGKIEPGQQVNIKVDNYPFMEYGILSGSVLSISKIPVVSEQGTFYPVNVDLPDKLVTNYNRELSYSLQMQGNAEIIIQNRRVIELLIEPLSSMFKGRK
ncbi:MAG: HlyD family efflux transporter periplasmic adaptor subunit [Bacteroidales bacterium]|nr:HlyD family efflux transporter periplasmic adaptor subunit [Bacteroidales bacterium]